jgi:hypothetical protein
MNFQDKSEMRWQNLIPLVMCTFQDKTILEEKGTLIVGDPKPIYHFGMVEKQSLIYKVGKDNNPFNKSR